MLCLNTATPSRSVSGRDGRSDGIRQRYTLRARRDHRRDREAGGRGARGAGGAVCPGCEAPRTRRSQNGMPGMNQFEKSLRKDGYSLIRPRRLRQPSVEMPFGERSTGTGL